MCQTTLALALVGSIRPYMPGSPTNWKIEFPEGRASGGRAQTGWLGCWTAGAATAPDKLRSELPPSDPSRMRVSSGARDQGPWVVKGSRFGGFAELMLFLFAMS